MQMTKFIRLNLNRHRTVAAPLSHRSKHIKQTVKCNNTRKTGKLRITSESANVFADCKPVKYKKVFLEHNYNPITRS